MNRMQISKASAGAASLALLALVFFGGCAVKTMAPWGSPETGLILKYQMPEGQVLKYRTEAEQIESTEFQGQAIKSETLGESTYSFKSKGFKEGNHELEVTIDSVSLKVSAMGQELSPDMGPVIGKSFTMILSPVGEEVDVSGAKSLEFTGASGTRNLASRFQSVFPNVADRPLKVGDSWTSNDQIDDEGDSSKVVISVENVHTLDGFETVDGMDCARIKTQVSGNLQGGGMQSGAEFTISGDFSGTDTWYFAYKEGIFVKMTSDALIEAAINITSPQTMSLPTRQEMRQEIALVK